MSRFGSLCILLLTALLMLLTVMACSEEDSAPLTPATAPSSATASPAATTPEPTATPSLITIDCNDPRFTKQILELSEGNQNQFSPRILKLYSDAEEIERTESVLRCRGTATLSRGGESNITYHYEIDRDGDAFIGYEIGDPIATPTPATSPSPGFTLDNPLPAGELLQGSDGTETRVLGVVEDARRQVAEENQFNDPPQEGKRFYMVSVEVSYPSGSSSITVSDTDFSLIGENRVVYDSFDYDCGVIPNELDGEVYGGGRIQGNICFEIPEDEGGFILIHEPGYEADSRRFLRLPYLVVAAPSPTLPATETPIPTATATATPRPTATPFPTARPLPTPTSEPTPTPTPVPITTATAIPSPTPMPTPTPTPVPITTAIPTLTPSPTPTPTPVPTATAIPSPTPTPTPVPAQGFGEGTWIVGSDIQPGTYAAGPGLEFCSWKRLSGFSGDFDDIIAIDISPRPIVTILATDAGFTSGGCNRWMPIADALTTPSGDGTWVVGNEFAPGTYSAPGSDFCSWKRLSGFSGDFDDIIAIDVGSGRQVVTIEETDVGFTSSGCGQWEKIG